MSYPPPPPGYGYGYAPPPDHPKTTTILILGIFSLFCALCGPFAWVMGKRTLDEIDSSGGTVGGRSNVMVGYVLGIVTTVLLLLYVVVLVVVVVLQIVAVAALS